MENIVIYSGGAAHIRERAPHSAYGFPSQMIETGRFTRMITGVGYAFFGSINGFSRMAASSSRPLRWAKPASNSPTRNSANSLSNEPSGSNRIILTKGPSVKPWPTMFR